MKILAVDTATESCSVAVVDNEELKAELTDVSGQTHSRHLMRLIEAALSTAGLTLHQMDGIAVTRGPGSFTGLRIGISVVKGLAMAAVKPVVGVSCLEALAWQTGPAASFVLTLMDARRHEVYYAGFRWMDGKPVLDINEQVGPIERAMEAIQEPCVVVGNGAVRYRSEIIKTHESNVRLLPFFMNTIRASTIAHAGRLRLLCGDMDDTAAFTPVYLRRSDAEVNLKRGG